MNSNMVVELLVVVETEMTCRDKYLFLRLQVISVSVICDRLAWVMRSHLCQLCVVCIMYVSQ